MFKEFDRSGLITFGSGNLPHWNQEGVTYFATFRLGDSLPEAKLGPWRIERDLWLRRHPRPWTDAIQEEYDREFTARIDRWLDAGAGSCIFKDRSLNGFMREVLRSGHSTRYHLEESTVADNHVHVVVEPAPGVTLSQILHSWKSYSAHQIGL